MCGKFNKYSKQQIFNIKDRLITKNGKIFIVFLLKNFNFLTKIRIIIWEYQKLNSIVLFKRTLNDIIEFHPILYDGYSIKTIANNIKNTRFDDDPKLNFFEWLFLRKMAVAWSISVGIKDQISRE